MGQKNVKDEKLKEIIKLPIMESDTKLEHINTLMNHIMYTKMFNPMSIKYSEEMLLQLAFECYRRGSTMGFFKYCISKPAYFWNCIRTRNDHKDSEEYSILKILQKSENQKIRSLVKYFMAISQYTFYSEKEKSDASKYYINNDSILCQYMKIVRPYTELIKIPEIVELVRKGNKMAIMNYIIKLNDSGLKFKAIKLNEFLNVKFGIYLKAEIKLDEKENQVRLLEEKVYNKYMKSLENNETLKTKYNSETVEIKSDVFSDLEVIRNYDSLDIDPEIDFTIMIYYLNEGSNKQIFDKFLYPEPKLTEVIEMVNYKILMENKDLTVPFNFGFIGAILSTVESYEKKEEYLISQNILSDTIKKMQYYKQLKKSFSFPILEKKLALYTNDLKISNLIGYQKDEPQLDITLLNQTEQIEHNKAKPDGEYFHVARNEFNNLAKK